MMFRGWFIILQTLNVAARFEIKCAVPNIHMRWLLAKTWTKRWWETWLQTCCIQLQFYSSSTATISFWKKNQTTKPQLYCQGVKWYSSGETPEGYIFSTTNVSGHTSEMKPVSAAEDFRIPSLLLWMYNYFVHKMPGDTVVSNEETIYLVRECTLETQPDWLARAQCFDVWDQQEVTVIFKLKNPKWNI